MKFKIGKTMIRIQATDIAGNVQKCQFTITVLGGYSILKILARLQYCCVHKRRQFLTIYHVL